MAARGPKNGPNPGVQSNKSQTSLPKVLRVGIIQNGKIIEERIIRNRGSVTVGPSEKNTFVISTSKLPSRFEMFETKPGMPYNLCFTDGMDGKISIGGSVRDFTELKNSGKIKKKGKVFQLSLKEDARGKVIVGDSTVLFQFVAPPPIQPRPQLPAAAKGGVFTNMEWFITIMWVVSFVLHLTFFTFLRVYPWPKQDLWQKYIAYNELIQPNVVIEKPKDKKKAEEGEGDSKDDGDDPGEEEDKPRKTGKKAKKSTPMTAAEKAAAARRKAEKRQLAIDQLGNSGINAILTAVGPGGENTGVIDVFSGGRDIGGDLDKQFSSIDGTVTGDGRGGRLRGPAGGTGGEGVDIGGVNTKGDDDVTTSGPAKERAPKGRVTGRRAEAVDGEGDLSSASIDSKIKGRTRAIKGCYEKALRKDPSLAGKVIIRFTIQGNGSVKSSRATMNELTPEVGSCISGLIKRIRFPQPDGGSVTIEKSFVFTS